jgi:hypothetical protein
VVHPDCFGAGRPPALQNKQLSIRVRPQDGAYEIFSRGLDRPVLISRVDAQINQEWIRSSDYPRHETSEAPFQDALGHGQALTLTLSGLAGKPDLVCKLRHRVRNALIVAAVGAGAGAG